MNESVIAQQLESQLGVLSAEINITNRKRKGGPQWLKPYSKTQIFLI